MEGLVILLVWYFFGLLFSNLLWIIKDMENSFSISGRLKESDHHVRVYVKGILFALILGPFAIIYVVLKVVEACKRMDKR